jgi:preprotein translocase subunit SecE
VNANPADWMRQARQYLVEVQAEYKKITWPPQKEAVAGTAGVLVIVAVIATVLGLIDFGLAQLVRLVLS